MRLLLFHPDEAVLARLAEAPRAAEDLSTSTRRHVDECDRCRRLLIGHRRAATLLGGSWRMVTAAQLVRSDGLDAVRPLVRVGPSLRPVDARWSRRRWLPLMVAVVALIVALVAAALVAVGRPSLLGAELTLVHGNEIVLLNGHGESRSITALSGGRAPDADSNMDRIPAWSPDGRHLAFLRMRPAGNDEQIMVVDYPSETVRVLGMVPRYTSGGLFWSPDSSRLAFWSGSKIDVVGVNGAGRRSVFGNCGGSACTGTGSLLSWSPDGRRLAASTGDGNLVAIDMVTGTVTTLVAARLPEGSDRAETIQNQASREAWSPDGAHLVFTSTVLAADREPTVEIVNLDGKPGRALHPGSMPTWSPNGRLIAFQTSTEPHGIYVIRPDGSGLRWLGDGVRPTWSPDGRQIAYCGHTAEDEGFGYYVVDAIDGQARLLVPDDCWYRGLRGAVSWRPPAD